MRRQSSSHVRCRGGKTAWSHSKDAQSILLATPQLPETIRRADHTIRAIPRPLGASISRVVQYPRRQVFVSSPHHRSGLEGVLRSGQRTSTKTASFSPKGGDKTQNSVILSPPINLFAIYIAKRWLTRSIGIFFRSTNLWLIPRLEVV